VAETLIILCAADLALFGAGLALSVGLATSGARVWRSSAPIRAAVGPALATLAGAATVEGLALGANAQYFWSSGLLLLINAVAFVFFLIFAFCSVAPHLARSLLFPLAEDDPGAWNYRARHAHSLGAEVPLRSVAAPGAG
jgi:hypothetical protein